MRPGELRQFFEDIPSIRVRGRVFLVIRVYIHGDAHQVDLLMDGEHCAGWLARWVEENSDVIGEDDPQPV